MTQVIVPIYNAPQATERCLRALARHTDAQTPVVLINDASSDPEVAAILQDVPRDWHVIDNDKNIGFVGSANLGLAITAPDDAVLLNADTEVTEGWLPALEACLASDPTIASTSPLTNHGEIASIPTFCQCNPYPEDPNLWARACREASHSDHASDHPPDWTDVPTTIGFCMLIRRRALDAVGFFDEAAFGRGYGEENDWCQRAIGHGFRHVLCDRAFVAHEGGASFGPLGLGPGGEAMAILRERYPRYEADVARFIEEDPLAERRQRIVELYRKTTHNRQP